MKELYDQAKERGTLFFYKKYCLYNNNNVTAFDAGTVRLISIEMESNSDNTLVTVIFCDGTAFKWHTKRINSYIYQFGIAASFDGKYIFLQTWENGLFCLDSRTGKKLWRTKSRRGITDLFINESTILCHQHEHALQLLDINTGEVVKEKRPASA